MKEMFVMGNIYHCPVYHCMAVSIISTFTGDIIQNFYEDRDSDYLHTCRLELDVLNRK